MKSLLQPSNESTVKSLSDSQLLALSVKKPAVFVELVERWRSRLFARAMRAMGNTDDAEDVVQETLVRIYKYAHRYEEQEGSEFTAWVYAILYNVVKTNQRRRARRSALVATSQVQREGENFPDVADPGFLEKLLDIDQAASILARLPRTVAGLLRDHVLEGKSYQELAQEKGVSVGTIRVQLYRARRSFQKTFQNQELSQ